MDYLILADFYRGPPEGSEGELLHLLYAQSRFPPLFPLLLAAVDAGGAAQHRAALLSCGIALLAVFASGWWVWREYRSPAAALTVVVALTLYPAYFLVNLYPVTEPLMMVLLALVFGVLAHDQGGPSSRLLAAALAGLLPLVRMAALPIIPVLIAWLLIHHRQHRRELGLLAAVALLPALAWQAYRTLLGAEMYTEHLSVAKILQQLGGWPDLLWLQAGRFWAAALENYRGDSGPLQHALLAVLTALAMSGWLRALRRRAAHAGFLALYLATIYIWPFPAEIGRLLVVVYPFAIAYACDAGMAATRRLMAMPAVPAQAASLVAVTLLLAALSGATVVRFVERATLPVPASLREDQREALYFIADTHGNALRIAHDFAAIRGLVAELHALVPRGNCVFMTPPQLVMLNARIPALDYPPGLADPEHGRQSLASCDYFILSAIASRQASYPPFYPWQALQGWTETVAMRDVSLDGRTSLAVELLKRSVSPAPAGEADGSAPAPSSVASPQAFGCVPGRMRSAARPRPPAADWMSEVADEAVGCRAVPASVLSQGGAPPGGDAVAGTLSERP
jgi:hypothetical protein